jgi:hypothetical protein
MVGACTACGAHPAHTINRCTANPSASKRLITSPDQQRAVEEPSGPRYWSVLSDTAHLDAPPDAGTVYRRVLTARHI